jgi:beta-1,4-mannosyl-glycoprotein beta-1,4-N-acetylglucosaminyltransferase
MITDAFLFFNELDLLEIRLNSLAPYVDQFVLCESTHTFTGNDKPLFFDQAKERFSKFNIRHVVADGGMNQNTGKNRGEPWKREYYQREFLVRQSLESMQDDDILLLSDVDEIPNLRGYEGREGVFRMRMYYYYLNCYTGKRNWMGTQAVKKSNVGDTNLFRDKRNHSQVIGKGWHFSYIASPENITYKIESFSHYDLNTEEKKSKIRNNRDQLLDPYNRVWEGRIREIPFTISMPSGPRWLLKNKEKYAQYFHN